MEFSGDKVLQSCESDEFPSSSGDEDLDFDEDEESDAEGLFDTIDVKFKQLLENQIQEAQEFYDRGILSAQTVEIAIQTEGLEATEEQRGTAEMETQTDEVEGVPICYGREERARMEIVNLRESREPLNLDRKGLVERIKTAKKLNSPSVEVIRWEEKQLFELEEAIEAIDLAIEFKNEIICGHDEFLLDEKSCPGKEKGDLVTRLKSLSIFDLQRLFCKFFTKVVELRFATKKLERNVEKLEEERERFRRMIAFNEKALNEKDKEHEERIKMLLAISRCAQNPYTALRSQILAMDQELNKSKKKLLDYQRSLTELLVRHGYLINGADFEVKQVVKMLGLGDISHLPAGRRRINERRNAEVSMADQMPSSSRHSSHHHQSSRQQNVLVDHRHRRENREEEIRKGKERRDPVEDQHTEVKRVRNKLIIQPNIGN